MKRYLFLGMVAVVALVVVNLVNIMLLQPSQEEKDQQQIDECWAESRGNAHAPERHQATIEACQMLEKVYRLNNGSDPLPRTKGV